MYILIIYIFAGPLAKGDSVTMTSVAGFTSEQACITAAKKTQSFVEGSAKEHRFACVKQ